MSEHSSVTPVQDHVLQRDDWQDAVAARDVGRMFAIIYKWGRYSYYRIGKSCGLKPDVVAALARGEGTITSIARLERVSDGLHIPGAMLGLAPRPWENSQELGLTVKPQTSLVRHEVDAREPSAQSRADHVEPIPLDIITMAELVGGRDEPMDRRALLRITAGMVAGVAVDRATQPWESLRGALENKNVSRSETIAALTDRTRGFYRLEEQIPARILYAPLVRHINDISITLDGLLNESQRHNLTIAAGESAALAGWLSFDLGNHANARQFYSVALQAAEDVGDRELVACILAYRSYSAASLGYPAKARDLLAQAASILPSNSSATTRAWVNARAAEESATLHDERDTLAYLEEASNAYSDAYPQEDRVWTRFVTPARFNAFHVAANARLGNIVPAQEHANLVIGSIDAERERKISAVVLTDVADAESQYGDPSAALQLGAQALEISQQTEFSLWLPRLDSLAQRLRPLLAKSEVSPFVDALDSARTSIGPSRR